MSLKGRVPWHVGWGAAGKVREQLGLVALLAPAAFLSTLTPRDGTWEQDDLEDAARRCAVDRLVIEHQAGNRQLSSLAA